MVFPIPYASKVPRGVYRHYKGGRYIVEGIAIKAGTESLLLGEQVPLVFYRPLYGDYSLRWRPLAEFMEIIPVEDAVAPRFVLETAF